MNPVYTINDTFYYPTVTCSGALCPPNSAPFVQNTLNNAIVPAGTVFGSCGAATALPGCATAGPTNLPDISNDPDYTSFLTVGGNLYSVVQFESPVPSAAYMMQINVAQNGMLSVAPGTLTAIDWSASGGLMNPCAGSVTPWQTHLGSEETIGNDARDFASTFLGATIAGGANTVALSNGFLMASMRYFGVYPNTLSAATVAQYMQPYKCVTREARLAARNTRRAMRHADLLLTRALRRVAQVRLRD